MRLKIIIPFFVGFLLLTCTSNLEAQINAQHSSQIAELERKGFDKLFTGGRIGSNERLTGTVASNNFDVNFYRCEWQIDPGVRYIKGNITSYFTITSATDKITYDLSDTLQVDSVRYHGSNISFQQGADDGLRIQF